MEFKLNNSQVSLKQIEEILKDEFPSLYFDYKTNSSGKHLIVKQNNKVAIGIWLENGKVIIDDVELSLSLPMLTKVILFRSWPSFFENFNRKDRYKLFRTVSNFLISKLA